MFTMQNNSIRKAVCVYKILILKPFLANHFRLKINFLLNFQVVRHFVQLDPKLSSEISLIADYSMESHAQDHANYINVSKNRKRRAKALLDFERHDDDELGFRKNDIITVISHIHKLK